MWAPFAFFGGLEVGKIFTVFSARARSAMEKKIFLTAWGTVCH